MSAWSRRITLTRGPGREMSSGKQRNIVHSVFQAEQIRFQAHSQNQPEHQWNWRLRFAGIIHSPATTYGWLVGINGHGSGLSDHSVYQWQQRCLSVYFSSFLFLFSCSCFYSNMNMASSYGCCCYCSVLFFSFPHLQQLHSLHNVPLSPHMLVITSSSSTSAFSRIF